MSNKSNGTAFEREFAQMLSERGFWVHLLKDNSNGQPFDVIGAMHDTPYAFDCKDCTGKNFELRRMEENQRNAMQLWLDREYTATDQSVPGRWRQNPSSVRSWKAYPEVHTGSYGITRPGRQSPDQLSRRGTSV